MKETVNALPVQKLPYSKKNDEWRERCVDYVIGASQVVNSSDIPSDEEIQSNYDLYNSLYNEKDLKYVTNPFKQADGFPAMAQDYNIIRPKIDLLIGEETKRPFNFKVCRTSEMANSSIQEEAKQRLMDYVQAYTMSKLGPEQQARYQEALASGEVMTPDQIHKYYTKDYKDVAEITAYHTLRYLTQKLNVSHEFLKGWRDGLIGGMTYYYVGAVNGEPYLEVVNPKEFKFAVGENVEFVHEADWCCRRMLMTASQIYDRLYDKMSEKDLDALLDMIDDKTRSGMFGNQKSNKKDDFNHISVKIYNTLPQSNPFSTSTEDIIVYHTCWRSYKKIGFVTIFNPETEEYDEFQVDEYYTETGAETTVEWKWVIEIWEGYRIGDDLYVGIQPLEHQFLNDDLNSQKLPYTGTVYNNANSKGKSLVSIMKPLQYMYIIIWYRVELLIARDKGKVLTVDITQIPKSMGIDVAKWMHYLSALGVNFINPYEEGWDVPGREGGKPSAFQQMASQDLSAGNVLIQYIELMTKIEMMLSEISGITQQRQGAISSNELVGNVERSVIQSANITEPLFWTHNQVKKHVLTMLLDTAKSVWGKANKRYLHYILDDATRAFLEISEDFPYESFDIFITDSTKENLAIEQIKQLIQPAMQNGASIVDAMDIITMDNVAMLKAKMEEIEAQRQERENAIHEREQQTQLQIEQMQAEIQREKLLIDQAKLDLEKYKIDTDATVRITVAELSAYRGRTELDQDGNGVPDPIEIANSAITQQKVNAEITSKQLEAANKAREAENKRKVEEDKVRAQEKADKNKAVIEKRKIALEEKKLKNAEKIQKMKDEAAMKREQLKAKTALANKTVGEK